MRTNKGILSDLLRILRIAQELVNHRIDTCPVATYNLIEGRLISIFKAIDQQPIEGNFLGFG